MIAQICKMDPCKEHRRNNIFSVCRHGKNIKKSPLYYTTLVLYYLRMQPIIAVYDSNNVIFTSPNIIKYVKQIFFNKKKKNHANAAILCGFSSTSSCSSCSGSGSGSAASGAFSFSSPSRLSSASILSYSSSASC